MLETSKLDTNASTIFSSHSGILQSFLNSIQKGASIDFLAPFFVYDSDELVVEKPVRNGCRSGKL